MPLCILYISEPLWMKWRADPFGRRPDQLEPEGHTHRSRFACRHPALPVRLCQDNDNPTPKSAHTTEHLIMREPPQKRERYLTSGRYLYTAHDMTYRCLDHEGDVFRSFENSTLSSTSDSSTKFIFIRVMVLTPQRVILNNYNTAICNVQARTTLGGRKQ